MAMGTYIPAKKRGYTGGEACILIKWETFWAFCPFIRRATFLPLLPEQEIRQS